MPQLPTLCDSMDRYPPVSLPGSSVCEILQTRILKWRGGGAGAAWQPPYGSVEPPPASGIGAAGSLRQWPALQRVRTSLLLPPSLLRSPASRSLIGRGFFTGGAAIRSGLKTQHFGWFQGLGFSAAAARAASASPNYPHLDLYE